MNGMPKVAASPSPKSSRSASGISYRESRNSPFADGIRARVQLALPYGSETIIVGKLSDVASENSVREQVSGRTRTSLDVILEGLQAMPTEARESIVSEMLAPLGLVVYRPAKASEGPTPLDALADATESLGRAAHEVREALRGDGLVDAQERTAILTEVATVEAACAALRKSVGGAA